MFYSSQQREHYSFHTQTVFSSSSFPFCNAYRFSILVRVLFDTVFTLTHKQKRKPLTHTPSTRRPLRLCACPCEIICCCEIAKKKGTSHTYTHCPIQTKNANARRRKRKRTNEQRTTTDTQKRKLFHVINTKFQYRYTLTHTLNA